MYLQSIEVLAEGLLLPEGPVVMSDGSVVLVEIARGTLTRIDASGSVSLVADVGGGPNGAAIGPDGAIYVCNNGGHDAATYFEDDGTHPESHWRRTAHRGSIQRVDALTGVVEELYGDLAGPNDIVFDTTGHFWFTDFAGGAIYYAAADGSSIEKALEGLIAPNGIGLSPDGGVLYWAQTTTRQVMRRRITSPGVLEPSIGYDMRAFVETGSVDPFVLLAGLPGAREVDSLAVEADGAVCVATLLESGITVIPPDGGDPELLRLPEDFNEPSVTNICFGGADLQTAYLTLSLTGKVIACHWPRPGLRLAFQV